VAAAHDSLAHSASLWSQQHDGYDPDRSRLVQGWLRLMRALSVPLADAGVPPTALTLAGVSAAGVAVLAADAAAPATLSAGLVLLTAVCDGLDGAVALRRQEDGRGASRHGALIDHTADRVTDVLFAAALCRAGASRRAATMAAVATVGYEGVRSLLRRRGRVGAVVTVGERPIRVAVVCAGLMAAPGPGAAIVGGLTTAAALHVALDARN